jgi:hypothetical protein
MKSTSTFLVVSTLVLLPLASACGGSDTKNEQTFDANPSDPDAALPADEWDQRLSQRDYNYNAALRIAALRLTGALPLMDDVQAVVNAADNAAKKAVYEAMVTKYMTGPQFAQRMMGFWRDTFKMGGSVELDTAPAFAAQLTVENRSYMELFTATAGNCPTMDFAAGTFAAGDCASGAPGNAGVLTNPGVMKQFFSNFAFRRVKWVQEAFVCTKFPAEFAATPVDVGNPTNLYTGKYPFESIAGTASGGRIDFRDVSAVICANCHSNMNHIAPLFANFDGTGQYKNTISVPTPLDGASLALITDYYPAGETTAWRLGAPAANLTELGAAIAADPAVAECAVARTWNWALGKTDIVDTLQQVPKSTISSQINAFTTSGYKLKDLVYAVYTSDDFTKF